MHKSNAYNKKYSKLSKKSTTNADNKNNDNYTLPPIHNNNIKSKQNISNNETYYEDKSFFNNEGSLGENIKVIVRVRPMLLFEKKRGDSSVVKLLSNNSLQLVRPGGQARNFNFTKIIPDYNSQHEFFHSANISIMTSIITGLCTIRIFSYNICLWSNWIRKNLYNNRD